MYFLFILFSNEFFMKRFNAIMTIKKKTVLHGIARGINPSYPWPYHDFFLFIILDNIFETKTFVPVYKNNNC